MPHRNTTQRTTPFGFNSYTQHGLGAIQRVGRRLEWQRLWSKMKPIKSETKDSAALEELGRATLQIVHDLKNQLNGLKLYATFLRKRLESTNQSIEERETLAKLIAGLDRAAKDMTALVRYARPVELHPQPRVNLSKIISDLVAEAAARETGGLPS